MRKNQWMWRTTWLLIAVIYLVNFAYYHRWQNMVTGGGDSWGYYAYLPSVFLHHDLWDLQKTIAIREEMHPGATYEEGGLRRAYEAPQYQGKNVNKYNYGVALMHTPAFLIAHAYVHLTGKYPANGYNRPYIFALYLSTVVYIFLGLFLIGKFLRHTFSDSVVMITLVLLALGTNLFYFGVINNVMAHPILFFLWAALISATHAYYEKPAIRTMCLVGALAGLIIVVRPVESICVLIPALYGLKSMKEFSSRLRNFFTTWRVHLIAGILSAVIVILPQLLYWKKLTGHWYYYSYPGEKLDLSNPHILSGLFGFTNGWLPFTPVMLFGITGFYFLWRMMKWNAFLFFLVMVLHIYVSYSWWNWSYINGFGSRPMVDIYPVMAFPLAACIQVVIKTKLKYILLPVWIGLILLNVFQMYQLEKGIMVSDMSNRANYFQIFGKTKFTQPMSVALDLKDYQFADIRPERLLAKYEFESDSNAHISTGRAASGSSSYMINTGDSSEQVKFEFRYEDMGIQSARGKYLMITVMIFVERQIGGFYDYDTFFIDFMRGDEVMKRQHLRLNNKTGEVGQFSVWWGEIQKWYPLTANIRLSQSFGPGDRMIVYPHNARPESVVYIDDLQFSLGSRGN